jgi:hypothetical protein
VSGKQGLAVKKPGNKENDTVSNKPKPDISQPVEINSPIEQVLQLQRTIGNQAVTRLIQSGTLQAKLKIGQPDDMYEQEADRVAEQIMRMSEGSLARKESEPECPECLEEEEEVEMVWPKRDSDSNFEVPRDIESGIDALIGGGQPLSESTRSFFEPRFGSDFSHVRVHTGDRAAEAARSIDARAFTTGRDIVFGSGQYSPGTTSGKHLLAHELTHVMQQEYGERTIHCDFDILKQENQDNIGEIQQRDPQLSVNIDQSNSKITVLVNGFDVFEAILPEGCVPSSFAEYQSGNTTFFYGVFPQINQEQTMQSSDLVAVYFIHQTDPERLKIIVSLPGGSQEVIISEAFPIENYIERQVLFLEPSTEIMVLPPQLNELLSREELDFEEIQLAYNLISEIRDEQVRRFCFETIQGINLRSSLPRVDMGVTSNPLERARMLDWRTTPSSVEGETLFDTFQNKIRDKLNDIFLPERADELSGCFQGNTPLEVIIRSRIGDVAVTDVEAFGIRLAVVYAVIETLNVDTTYNENIQGRTEISDRYQPVIVNNITITYCNIYAYDVVTALGGYLPRLWWNDDSIVTRIRNGENILPVPGKYGNVFEVSVNDLIRWMTAYGEVYFGWRQWTDDITEAQDQANQGKIVILLSQGTNHGHVQIVLPKIIPPEHEGELYISEAGASNSMGRFFTPGPNQTAWIFEGPLTNLILTPQGQVDLF